MWLYWLLPLLALILAAALRLWADDGPRRDEDDPPDTEDGDREAVIVPLAA